MAVGDVTFSGTVGGVTIAACLSCFLCGIVISLAGRYFTKFSEDRLWIRIAVLVSTLWAVMDTVFHTTWAYKWGVTYYIQPQNLTLLPWELTGFTFCMSTAVIAVEIFYLYRLHAVSNGNWFLIVPLSAVLAGCYAIALYMGYVCVTNPDDIDAYVDARGPTWGWFGGILLIDLVITASMFYYMVFQPQKNAGRAAKSTPLKQAVLKAAQTNSLSALCQLCIVVLYGTNPSSMYYSVFAFPEAKIYIGSFLATLNARSAYSQGEFDAVNLSRAGKAFHGMGEQPVHVTVRQEVNIDAEEDDISLNGKKEFPVKAQLAATPYRVQFARNVDGGDVEKGGRGDSESF
ncbi:hypothetical protein JCM3770_004110 [Rhodotorula araucariae]